MRILIDGRFIGVGESMTRYTLEILQGILKLDTDNDYTVLIRPQGKKLLSVLKDIKNLTIETLDIPHYSISEQTKLLKYLNHKKFDLVHFIQFNHPIRYKGKYVVTVHDLTLLGHLHRMGKLKTAGFKTVMRSAIKDSSKIITDSKFSKNDLLQMYKVDASKLEVVYLGVDDKYNASIKNNKSEIDKFKDKYKISGDYVLYTGMWKRHKNLLRMLKAFEKFLKSSEANIQLVMVGKIDDKEPEIIAEINRINRNCHSELVSESQNNDAIITTGFIDEAELPIAYAGAFMYCIPSLSEGFGLPPLEAMACGTPVISSNASCMPEILGDAAYYFDPYNIASIAHAMGKISSDNELREDLVQKGIERAAKYDWANTAKQTHDVYKEILKS